MVCIFCVNDFVFIIETQYFRRYPNCNINIDVWRNIYWKWIDILDKICFVKQIRLTCRWFSHLGKVYSVSLSLLYGLLKWKLPLCFSLSIIRLDEPINVKSVKSQFTKNYHTRWRTKNDGSDKLWFNFDKTSKVKNLKRHVTACFSAVKKECFCLQLGFFINFWLKTNSYAF